MKAIIRSTETQTIEVDADSYQEGKDKLAAQLPEGFQILSYQRD